MADQQQHADPEIEMRRYDLRRRSRLHLRCASCGSFETRYVPIADAGRIAVQMRDEHRCIAHDSAMGHLRKWFAENVPSTDECVLWDGGTASRGYGKFGHWYVHRASYVHHIGPIPDGLTIDHLCAVKLCCNPRHLEAVTAEENHQRWVATLPTTCGRGHEINEENTYFRKSDGRVVQCRVCRRERRAVHRPERGRVA